jgi:uncharacterized protein GlcG (DUF336 family)
MRASLILASLILPAALSAQPSLDTQLLNGVTRVVALHAADGAQVTDASPAMPGETLIVQGSSLTNAQFLAGAAQVPTLTLDDNDAQIALPADAGSSFLVISATSDAGISNSATVPVAAAADGVQLSAAEVQTIVTNTAMGAAGNGLAVAVVDRIGNPLALYVRPGATPASVELALALARTGAFFGIQGTPISSRTVGFISSVNFPPGVPNQPSGPLYGIGNTNRGCDANLAYLPGQLVPQPLSSAGTGPSLGIATVPGGLPLFRGGYTVVGGVGAAGLGSDDADEYAAAAGASASGFFVGLPLPSPGAVYLNGFELPFINSGVPAGVQPASSAGGVYQIGPNNGAAAPEGWIVGPNAGSQLSVSDVTGLVQNAIQTASLTRAAIRLPAGTRAAMAISVSDLDGTILGIYRMTDATIFSVDVALTKARNVVYFSGPNRDSRDLPGVPAGTAVTTRTIGFGSQIYFPSGILNTQPGPFYPMYLADVANPCTQGHQPSNPNQSGIVFFPGSEPLYRNGQLVGGMGVSGDGVDQDDFVTDGGAAGFQAPAGIRADQILIRGVRLPYLSFPRNPEQ